MDFRSVMAGDHTITDDQAKKLGEAVAEPMDDKYKRFIQDVLKLMKDGTINPELPETFVKRDVYETLPPELKRRADMAIVNIAHQLRLITEFFLSTKTPNESPQLVTMIEQLWLMKEPIEREADVFVF